MKALSKLTFCRNLLFKLSSKKYTPPKFKHKVFIEPNFNGKGKRKAEYVIKDCFGEGLNDFHELRTTLFKESGYKDHPYFKFNSIYKRLLERDSPSEYVRLKNDFLRRKQDRAVVKDFCRKVLYLEQKYVPK